MGKYSSVANIKEEIIKSLSVETDHYEAQAYIERLLEKAGADAEKVGITPLLQQVSVVYATQVRAFKASKTKDDELYEKFLIYEERLRKLTGEAVRAYIPKPTKKVTYKCTDCENDGSNDKKTCTFTMQIDKEGDAAMCGYMAHCPIQGRATWQYVGVDVG
jgi:hypothetical protein